MLWYILYLLGVTSVVRISLQYGVLVRSGEGGPASDERESQSEFRSAGADIGSQQGRELRCDHLLSCLSAMDGLGFLSKSRGLWLQRGLCDRRPVASANDVCTCSHSMLQ